jgi:hypothetical protein
MARLVEADAVKEKEENMRNLEEQLKIISCKKEGYAEIYRNKKEAVEVQEALSKNFGMGQVLLMTWHQPHIHHIKALTLCQALRYIAANFPGQYNTSIVQKIKQNYNLYINYNVVPNVYSRVMYAIKNLFVDFNGWDFDDFDSKSRFQRFAI